MTLIIFWVPHAASGNAVRMFPVSDNVMDCGLQMGVVDLMKALPVHLIACLLAQQPQRAGDSLSVSICRAWFICPSLGIYLRLLLPPLIAQSSRLSPESSSCAKARALLI